MKRLVPIIVIIAVGAAVTAGIFWRAPLLAALGIAGEEARYLGYVEGETSLIAPPVAGRLVERPVDRGQQVRKGDRLFVIDPVLAKAEVARSEGALAEAQSRYENLLKGKRPEELDVMRGQRREAEESLALAETELKRQGQLLERGFTTRQNFDQAQSQVYQLRSRVASLTAQEKVGALAARPDEIDAAKAQVEQDEANLAQARKRLDDLMPAAPEDGLIENTFFNVGEWVPAGSPVVSLLPPFRVKLRFYVPQEDVALVKIGDPVSFTCDGCPPDLTASIIYISPRAEFTPPVIYSQTARSKLVFLIEARPQTPEARLSPGLPVTVAPFTK
jgi:HlyD family secretion protein